MKYGVSKKGSVAKAPHKDETVNKAGGVAYNIPDPATRLMHIVGQMFNEPTYYEDLKPTPTDRLAGLTSEARAVVETAEALAASDNWRDLLAIAAYAREELHMRTTPVILFAVAAEAGANKFAKNGKAWARAYADKVMQRADEPRLVFAAWRALYGNIQDVGGRVVCTNFPRHRVKNPIGDRLAAFPEHLLAKYDADGSPSLRDTIRACAREHMSQPKLLFFVDRAAWEKGGDPKKGKVFDPKVETPTLWAKVQLAKMTEFNEEAKVLATKSRATWENLSSQFKGDKRVWEFIGPNLGYMAMLRNLRNMVQAGIDLTASGVLAKITDANEVLNSKQLPFRFFSAARIFDPSIGARNPTAGVEKVDSPQNPAILDAIDRALTISVQSLPRLPGKTAVFIDNSGSMDSKVSGDSTVSKVDAGNILGAMMAVLSDDVRVCAFTNMPYPVAIRKADSVLTNMARVALAGGDGGSTDAHKCAPWLQAQDFKADRIILISDMQCWDSGYGNRGVRESIMSYRKWAGKNTWVHSINIGGTVEAQMAQGDPNVNLMSGFSDQLVKAIAAAESPAGSAKDPETKRQLASLAYVREKYVI